ncbi:hypothetical protein KC322_g42 [Hortaea werneckii]|nr:hypothetical protein KC322_g42 [Hortaea werneckii]
MLLLLSKVRSLIMVIRSPGPISAPLASRFLRRVRRRINGASESLASLQTCTFAHWSEVPREHSKALPAHHCPWLRYQPSSTDPMAGFYSAGEG